MLIFVCNRNLHFHDVYKIMASPPASPPPPPPSPPPPPPSDASTSPSVVKRTRKASRLRSLSTRPPGAERLVVHVDPATSKADGPHKKKLRTYLGIVAHDKVDVTYENRKEVLTTQKDLIWEDIQDGVDDTVCEKYNLSKEKWAQFCQTRRDPSWEMCAKRHRPSRNRTLPPTFCLVGTKKKLEEAAQSGNVDGVIDPPSPVRRHVKWKMAHTKKTGEMMTEAAKEIAEKIDVLTAAIRRPEHPGCVRAAGAGVTIKQYFGSAPRTSRSSSSLSPEELQQLTHQMQSQIQSLMQSQGLTLPPEPMVGPSGPRISTKGSCVDPSGNDPEMGDSDRCGLYIEADPACLVALGRVYEGSTIVHNAPLLPGQVKVGVEEVTDAYAPVPVPTDKVSLVGKKFTPSLLGRHIWSTVSPAKPPPKPDPEVDDPLYLMTLTILELFLRPYQVTWDATMFGVFNPDFPLYIKHEDLSEIAHSGQCLNISVLQLWILNSDIYGFLEPQSIQRSGQSQFESESYIKTWMHSSKCDVYLGAYLNDTECGYYVMHWMSTIILGNFRNNWEAYFNDLKPLEPERLKVLRIQWTQYYFRVRDQT
ncbi:hypothetical protein HKD37_14G040895 [Glycine soja]